MDQVKHIVPTTIDDAERYLCALIDRLDKGTATSAEHAPALETIMLLPEPSADEWFFLIRRRMAVVYEHERHQRVQNRLNQAHDPAPEPDLPTDR